MSAKIMGGVFDLQLTPPKQTVLLAYADHADHSGNNVFPSKGYIAWKTGYSERQVQRITELLIKDGIMIAVETPAGKAIKYRIDLGKGTRKPEYVPKSKQNVRGDKMSGGDILTEGGKQNKHNDVTPTPDIDTFKSDDEPSLNPYEPSDIAAAPDVVSKSVPPYLIPVFTAVVNHIFKLHDLTTLTNADVKRYRAMAQIARTKAGGKDTPAEEIARLVRCYAAYCNDKGYTAPQAQDKFSSGFDAYLQNNKPRPAAPINHAPPAHFNPMPAPLVIPAYEVKE